MQIFHKIFTSNPPPIQLKNILILFATFGHRKKFISAISNSRNQNFLRTRTFLFRFYTKKRANVAQSSRTAHHRSCTNQIAPRQIFGASYGDDRSLSTIIPVSIHQRHRTVQYTLSKKSTKLP